MNNKTIATVAVCQLICNLQAISIGEFITNPRIIKPLQSSLNLSNRDIDSLDGIRRASQKYPRLKHLNLSGNRLSVLPNAIFSAFTNLRTLSLGGNKLQMLPAQVFRGLSKLETIGLSFNELQALPVELLREQTRLKEIDLSFNQLATLPEGIFHYQAQLENINLKYNQLQVLPAGFFDWLPNLRSLQLYHNQFGEREKRRIQLALPGVVNFETDAIQAATIKLTPNIDARSVPAGTICSICLEGEGINYKTACGHYYHAHELQVWLQKSAGTACPLCRRDIFTGQASSRVTRPGL